MLTLEEDFFENLAPVWKQKLSHLKDQSFFKDLSAFLKQEYASGKVIYPARENILRALQEVDLPSVKVVILGQDPYHGPGQAMGFSFAVPNGLRMKPPSLKNIFKEVESDLGVKILPGQSDLTGWVKQNVLLLNTVLTVEADRPLSHRDRGWEPFTHCVIEELNHRKEPMVFILWGSHAQKFKGKINLERHCVLESAHPSPLSAYRGFLGSKVFSKANAELVGFGLEPIFWERVSASDSLPK